MRRVVVVVVVVVGKAVLSVPFFLNVHQFHQSTATTHQPFFYPTLVRSSPNKAVHLCVESGFKSLLYCYITVYMFLFRILKNSGNLFSRIIESFLYIL
jgi:hypothetical protein